MTNSEIENSENPIEIKEKFHLPVVSVIDETPKVDIKPLLTGKRYVSFSEVKLWHECPWRHKLKYVDGIDLDSDSVHTVFGKVVHDICEHFFMTREMLVENLEPDLRKVWLEHKFEEPVESWVKSGIQILTELPTWIDETFPGWLPFAAEELLMERFEKYPDVELKGYVDVVIKVPKKRQPKNAESIVYDYMIIDLKTCSYFWRKDKIMDPNVYNQVVIYKHFWCMKHAVNPQDVKTAFVLLRRTIPKKSTGSCMLLPISAGPITTEKALKWLHNMIATLKRGFYIKNRFSCQWCPYKGTEHCPEF